MNSLDYLKKLISIKSYSVNENEEIIEYLKKEFGEVAEEIIEIKSDDNEKSHLLIGLNTKLKNVKDAVILSGHADTVNADEDAYSTNPYVATVEDGKVYGLGSIDMKSFFAVILANKHELKAMNVPIIISITGDEEMDFIGINLISKKIQELNIQPKLAIIGEPSNSNISAESKGCMIYKINIVGKGCHSSMPYNGINANCILAHLVLFIEKLCYKYPNTTACCNVIQGGEKDNIVSGSAHMLFDIRTSSVAHENSIIKAVKNKIKVLLKQYDGAKIYLNKELNVLPLENKNPEFIQGLCDKVNLQEVAFSGACEAGYFQMLGANSFIFGVGDLALAHKPNEYAEIEELESYFGKLKSILDCCKK